MSSSVPDPSIATAPNAPHDLQSLIRVINSHSDAFSNGETDARLRLVAAAQSLVQAMETPQEAMLRYIWAQVISHPSTPSDIGHTSSGVLKLVA